MDRRENSSLLDQANFINPFASSQTLMPIAPSIPAPLHDCYTSSMSPGTALPIQEYSRETETEASSDGYDSDATLDLACEASSPLAAAFLQDAPPLRRMSRDYERVVLRSLSYSQAGGVTFACACSRDGGQGCSRHIGKWTDEDDELDNEYDSEIDEEEEEYYLEESSDDEGSQDPFHIHISPVSFPVILNMDNSNYSPHGYLQKITPSDSPTGADTLATSVVVYENFVHLLLSDASDKLDKLDAAHDTRRCMRYSSLTGCAEAPF